MIQKQCVYNLCDDHDDESYLDFNSFELFYKVKFLCDIRYAFEHDFISGDDFFNLGEAYINYPIRYEAIENLNQLDFKNENRRFVDYERKLISENAKMMLNSYKHKKLEMLIEKMKKKDENYYNAKQYLIQLEDKIAEYVKSLNKERMKFFFLEPLNSRYYHAIVEIPTLLNEYSFYEKNRNGEKIKELKDKIVKYAKKVIETYEMLQTIEYPKDYCCDNKNFRWYKRLSDFYLKLKQLRAYVLYRNYESFRDLLRKSNLKKQWLNITSDVDFQYDIYWVKKEYDALKDKINLFSKFVVGDEIATLIYLVKVPRILKEEFSALVNELIELGDALGFNDSKKRHLEALKERAIKYHTRYSR